VLNRPVVVNRELGVVTPLPGRRHPPQGGCIWQSQFVAAHPTYTGALGVIETSLDFTGFSLGIRITR
jgi:hypothetical protein